MADLTSEKLDQVAKDYKEGLQREVNRCVLRKDLLQACASLAGIEIVDAFVYQLKIRMGSKLGLPAQPAERRRDARVKRRDALAERRELAERRDALAKKRDALASQERRDALAKRALGATFGRANQ